MGWARLGGVRLLVAAPPQREPAMDAATLELDAVKFAQLAVQRDQSGRYQEAVFYYKVWGGCRCISVPSGRWCPLSPSRPLALELSVGLRSSSQPPEGWGREGWPCLAPAARPGLASPHRRREVR